MKGVVVFALPILIMFPFRKQLPITHCCLDCSEVPSELHHGECSPQVSLSLAVVIIAVCNPGRVTWSCVFFCWPGPYMPRWQFLCSQVPSCRTFASAPLQQPAQSMPSALGCASSCTGL